MTRSTENQRAKHNLRRKARRNFLDVLYARQNSLCWWCKSACVIVANIPEEDRRGISNGFVTWRIGDDTFRAKMATVDHVDPLGETGTNDEENVVMACVDCNKDRTRKASITRLCQDCGTVLKHRKTKHCHRCSIRLTIRWLGDHGWQEVPNPDGDETHTRFRDPQTGVDHILRHACEILRAQLGGHEAAT